MTISHQGFALRLRSMASSRRRSPQKMSAGGLALFSSKGRRTKTPWCVTMIESFALSSAARRSRDVGRRPSNRADGRRASSADWCAVKRSARPHLALCRHPKVETSNTAVRSGDRHGHFDEDRACPDYRHAHESRHAVAGAEKRVGDRNNSLLATAACRVFRPRGAEFVPVRRKTVRSGAEIAQKKRPHPAGAKDHPEIVVADALLAHASERDRVAFLAISVDLMHPLVPGLVPEDVERSRFKREALLLVAAF